VLERGRDEDRDAGNEDGADPSDGGSPSVKAWWAWMSETGPSWSGRS